MQKYRNLFLVLWQNFNTSVDKKTIQTFFASPNKSKLHSFAFEIMPLSSVKSQNVCLTDFFHALGVGKLSIGL